MTSSIGYQLGIGSGLDIQTLVTQLANAQREPKQALIERRQALNEARISGLAEMSGAIDSFSAAVTSLIGGGSLFTQPTVSNSAILTARALPGARIGGLAAELEVVALAKAQTLQSTYFAARSDAVGQGTLTLTTASGSHDIVVDGANDSLDGLAAAINAKRAGVTATVVTDSGGARLVLKGATGAAAAFTLAVPGGTTSGLERFAFGPGVSGGLTEAQAAQDATVKLDGVSVNRATNSFSDLIPGVQIDLKQATPGTIVSIGAERPTAAIQQAVGDFVAAYNEMMSLMAEKMANGADGAAGPLRGDLGMREMRRQLAALPTIALTAGGDGPHTLAEVGVRTNRDGTLSLDSGRLQAALAADPDAVEALFNPTQFASSAAVTIKSAVGRVKPGTYTLTDLVPQNGAIAAAGKLDGVAMTGVGTNLVAPSNSAAVGLVVTVQAAAASVTVTIEPGLGGALQAIRDALRARTGPFAATQERLDKEKAAIADDLEALELRSDKYYDQLLGTFTAMERQVSAFKATQSYLEQQIKVWTADR
jgi:flagellar hook-associated protein 2